MEDDAGIVYNHANHSGGKYYTNLHSVEHFLTIFLLTTGRQLHFHQNILNNTHVKFSIYYIVCWFFFFFFFKHLCKQRYSSFTLTDGGFLSQKLNLFPYLCLGFSSSSSCFCVFCASCVSSVNQWLSLLVFLSLKQSPQLQAFHF